MKSLSELILEVTNNKRYMFPSSVSLNQAPKIFVDYYRKIYPNSMTSKFDIAKHFFYKEGNIKKACNFLAKYRSQVIVVNDKPAVYLAKTEHGGMGIFSLIDSSGKEVNKNLWKDQEISMNAQKIVEEFIRRNNIQEPNLAVYGV